MEIMRNFKFMISFFVLCIIVNKILSIMIYFITDKNTSIKQYYKLFCKDDLNSKSNEEILEHMCDILEDWGYKHPTISESLDEIVCYKNNIATMVYFIQDRGTEISSEILYSIIGEARAKKISCCMILTTDTYSSQCYDEMKKIKKSGIDITIIDGIRLTNLIRKNIEKQILTEGVV